MQQVDEEAQADVNDIQLVQSTKVSQHLPDYVRVAFIKKVYGLLLYMLVITFAMTAPFVFNTDKTMAFMKANPAIVGIATVCFLGFYAMNIALVFATCCGCDSFTRAYLGMFKRSPINLIFLTFVAVTFGLPVGFICAQYTATSVCYAFLMSAGLCAALTVYAVQRKGDVTGMGMYIFVGCIGMLLLMPLLAFAGGAFMNKIVAGLFVIFFGFMLVYDTQLIFGCVTFSGTNSRRRQFEYTLDMYAFATYNLYLDFINIFLYMLELMGERR